MPLCPVWVHKLNLSETQVVFIASGFICSDQTLKTLISEFGVRAARFDTLSDFLTRADRPQVLRLLVVDEEHVRDLLESPSDFASAAAGGRLVLAYRFTETARRFRLLWPAGEWGEPGYLPMKSSIEVWLSSFRLLLHEEPFVPVALLDTQNSTQSPSILAQAASAPTAETLTRTASVHVPDFSRGELDRFTRRELQVLEAVARGLSNKSIATELGITGHTVKLHLHNVITKIGVPNRTAAAQYYYQVTGGFEQGG